MDWKELNKKLQPKRVYFYKQTTAFRNDSLVVDKNGQTASARALEKVSLKGLFENFDKNDFSKFIQKAWTVNETNRLAERTPANWDIILKNAEIVMAGLDVLDFSIRRRFYLLDRSMDGAGVADVIQKRLLETARIDGVVLPRVVGAQRQQALDIQKEFPFQKVKEKPQEKLDLTRAGNMSVTHTFPRVNFETIRYVMRRRQR